MHLDLAMRMMSELLWTGLAICSPMLIVTMLVGVLIGILQVVTQIQELSLSFVPKLISAVAVVLIAGPWMLKKLSNFTTIMWTGIPSMF